MISLLGTTVIAATMLICSVANSATPIVPYGDSEWRYKQFPLGEAPEGWQTSSYDDTDFAMGCAPFSDHSGPCNLLSCTSWGLQSSLILRRVFELPARFANLRLRIAIDNDLHAYVNGVYIGSHFHETCAVYDGAIFDVPDSVLNSGTNTLAIHALDYGGVSFFDARLEGEIPVPSTSPSWGRVKSIYR